MQKGEIFWVDIGEKDGCVQSGGKDGLRPCLIVSNDTACRVSPVITVVPISSSPRRVKRTLPVHMHIQKPMALPSVLLFEQITTVNARQICQYIGTLSAVQMQEVDLRLKLAFGIA